MLTLKLVNTTLDHVQKLKKALYRLKELPCIWFELHEQEMNETGLHSLQSAAFIFKGEGVPGVCYVDDFLGKAENTSILSSIKRRLAQLPPANESCKTFGYLRVTTVRERDNSFMLSQHKYVKKLIEEVDFPDGTVSRIPYDMG